MKTLKQSLFPIHISPEPVQTTLDNEGLSDEIKQMANTASVDSIVYYEKDDGMHLNNRATYDFFWFARITNKLTS